MSQHIDSDEFLAANSTVDLSADDDPQFIRYVSCNQDAALTIAWPDNGAPLTFIVLTTWDGRLGLDGRRTMYSYHDAIFDTSIRDIAKRIHAVEGHDFVGHRVRMFYACYLLRYGRIATVDKNFHHVHEGIWQGDPNGCSAMWCDYFEKSNNSPFDRRG